MSTTADPALFGSWLRAQLHAVARARYTGLRYRVERGPDWVGHPRWQASPLPQAVPAPFAQAPPQPRAVRAWATAKGLPVSSRGRLPTALVQQYLDEARGAR